jgi:peptidoglycan/xylan/chitin deacetylase (PgdA/CDA1 family)
MSQRTPFDHSAPPDNGPPALTVQRRRQAIGAIAFVALVLGAAVGSSAGNDDSPAAAAVKPKPQLARRDKDWVAHPGPVPILMYHGVDSATDPPLAGLQIPSKEFRSQLRWLHRNGYEAVTMHEVARAWSGLGKLPRKPIVLTFDDGFHSQERVAFTAMEKYDWPGVLNLAVNNLTWDRGITFDEAQTMIDGGWELASHTINHTDLRAAGPAQLRHELVDSKRILEATFRRRVTAFCYPGGATDARVQKAVRKAGYHSATSVVNEVADSSNPFNISRIHVDPGLTGPELGAKLGAAAKGDVPPPPQKYDEGPVT